MRDKILLKQPVSAGVVHQQIYSKHHISKESLISAQKQLKQQARVVNCTTSWKLLTLNPRKVPQKIKFENIYRGCKKKTISLKLPNEFLSNKKQQKLQIFVFQSV